MTAPWLVQYPVGVPAEIDTAAVPTLVSLLETAVQRHPQAPAVRFMGRSLSYSQLDTLSGALGAWMKAQGLRKGDRVALMMPNIPQVPVCVLAAWRAGLVVVSINPLLTARELEHQLRDSGARAVVVLENHAATLQPVLQKVAVTSVLVTAMGDLLGLFRGTWVNLSARHARKTVPPFELPAAQRFSEALAQGRTLASTPVAVAGDDIAVLQYTGGTSGLAKGAVLLHRNLVANVLQCDAWCQPALRRLPPGERPVIVGALPLHHIFGFTLVMLLSLRWAGCMLLVPDARDIPHLLRTLKRESFHCFPGVNPLFSAIARHPDAVQVDWSGLVLSIGGGMGLHPQTAQLWQACTGCVLCEGYGLSETSPCVSCHPTDLSSFRGGIGLPLPGTLVRLIDDQGRSCAAGEAGELLVKGPQVMAGYWQRPEETARAMTADGYLRTGDLAVMDTQGQLRLVDRKKDVILVDGFNVYPSEVEEALLSLAGIREVAVLGAPDPGPGASGEWVKAVIVRHDPELNEAAVRAHAELQLTGYKRPRIIRFVEALPRSATGKVLKRELQAL